jgi:hypothetical protein
VNHDQTARNYSVDDAIVNFLRPDRFFGASKSEAVFHGLHPSSYPSEAGTGCVPERDVLGEVRSIVS